MSSASKFWELLERDARDMEHHLEDMVRVTRGQERMRYEDWTDRVREIRRHAHQNAEGISLNPVKPREFSPHLTEGIHTEEPHRGPTRKGIALPELEKRENARWLALFIDTEGAMGWANLTQRKDRVNLEYKYVHIYTVPYVTVSMMELESKKTIDAAARLLRLKVYTKLGYIPLRLVTAVHTRALTAITLTKPYLDKFSRMADLLTTLFKLRSSIPIETFNKTITTLFGKPLKSKEANDTMLKMTEPQFQNLKKLITYNNSLSGKVYAGFR